MTMTHSNFSDLLPWYIRGTLPETDSQALVAHLDDCEDCRRSLAEWRLINQAVLEEMESFPTNGGDSGLLLPMTTGATRSAPLPHPAPHSPPVLPLATGRRLVATAVACVLVVASIALFSWFPRHAGMSHPAVGACQGTSVVSSLPTYTHLNELSALPNGDGW